MSPRRASIVARSRVPRPSRAGVGWIWICREALRHTLLAIGRPVAGDGEDSQRVLGGAERFGREAYSECEAGSRVRQAIQVRFSITLRG